VSGRGKDKQAGVIARTTCGAEVSLAQLDGDILVVLAVDEDPRDSQRQQLDRGGSGIASGIPGGAAAEKGSDGTVAEAQLPGAGEIGHRCEGDGAAQPEWMGCRQRGARSDAVAPPHPERQLPPGGMPQRNDAVEVKVVEGGEVAQEVGGGSHVEQSARPAAPRLADSAVLDVPGGKPGLGECRGGMAKVGEIVARTPVAAMEEKDGRMGSGSGGESKLAELRRLRTVGNTTAGRREEIEDPLGHRVRRTARATETGSRRRSA
jgi:hypothetical protein